VLGSAVLIGLGAAALLSAARPRLAVLATGMLAVLLPLEHWSWPRAAALVPAGADVPDAFAFVAQQPAQPLVHLPLYPERSRTLWAAYLNFSTHHWRPIPVGRTSFYPPAHDYLAWSLLGFPDDTSLAVLDRLGIRTIVVHPHVWDAGERTLRLSAIESTARLRLVKAFDDQVPARYSTLGLGDERVYALDPAPFPSRPCAPADEIPREAWTFASSGIKSADRVRDGDRSTSWFTERPQEPGDFLEVRLPEPEPLSAVELGISYPFGEFPREPALFLQDDDGRWARVTFADGPAERADTLSRLLEEPEAAAMVLRFATRRALGVRIALAYRAADPAWPRWSIAELRLHRACR